MPKLFHLGLKEAVPFRDAASTHVRLPRARVIELLSDPGILQAIEPRVPTDHPLTVAVDGDVIEVGVASGHLHLSFRVTDERGGTRLAVEESVRTHDPIEAGKHMFLPQLAHRELEDELQRLRLVLEAVGHRS